MQIVEELSEKLRYIESEILQLQQKKAKYILLQQRDVGNIGFYAEVLGSVLDRKIELLAFHKGEKFRLWLNQNRTGNVSLINDAILHLQKNKDYSVLEITKVLEESGYNRVLRVQYPGEFSLLGDLLYVSLAGYKEILRLSFFGNTLENLSFVGFESRKVTYEVEETTIYSNNYSDNHSDSLNPLIKQKRIVPDSFVIGNQNKNEKFELQFILVADGLPGFDLKKLDLGINSLPGGEYLVGEIDAINRLINLYQAKDWKVFFLQDSENKSVQIESLQRQLNNSINYLKIDKSEIDIIKHGFEVPMLKAVYFSPYELFAELDLNIYGKSTLINRGKIKKGDYVVHSEHGIAIFDGIVEREGKSYLLLKYAGEDKLYIPFDAIENVTKYLGSRKGVPSLTKLNGGNWNRAKMSVRKDIEQIAKELLQLYTLRKNTKTDSKLTIADSDIQQRITEFLKAFPYEETEDQLVSTQEILLDLQKEYPMDRLLVGDVGFGKTEVAMRAVFAMTCIGKQVAILAPTTVLVEQHKAVFKKRFENFKGIRIESLSRFQNVSEQRAIIEDLEQGKIDILIGTHSLLSDKVRFKSLGLIVIDEEQRFGVKHKEKLKLRRLDSHVLTLTATPIPRTLNMSLSGVRDISVIQTPPQSRKPIKNYTGERNWDLIIQAIQKEKDRAGQIYFLHNRVRDIESVALKINELMPEIIVDVAHGQMAVHQLAKVMRDFAAGRIDVLVCTTIIENGIDLPNVNTLIVDDIEKLGLSQMYQIRGRIGRADKQAYAYFFFDSLRGNSSLRLEAMKEFQELGVGYKLANRDMEIRGAGSILGDSQSGFIDNVGYSLYMQMLNEEISKKVDSQGLITNNSMVNIERIWLR